MYYPKFRDQFVNDDIAMLKYIALLYSGDARVRRHAYQKLREAAYAAQSELAENECAHSSHFNKDA